jgi:hypothetical protein
MQEHIDQLIKVYNTLFSINTKGEDTIIMAQCLTTMRDTLVNLQQMISGGETAVQ